LLNTGVGVPSGLFNKVLQADAGLSGVSNEGSGSGIANLGSAVSGLSNTSSVDVSEPAFVSGVGNVGSELSGLFQNNAAAGAQIPERSGNLDQLDLPINIDVSQIPLTLDAKIGVDIPITADLGDLTLQGFTIPGFPINVTNWTQVHNEAVSAKTPLGDILTVYLDVAVPDGVLPLSDITLEPVTVQLPQLSALIGGPDASIGLNLNAGAGPFTITVPISTTSPYLDDISVSKVPLDATLNVPVDVPLSLKATPIKISQIEILKINLGEGVVIDTAIKANKTPPTANNLFRNPCPLACAAVQLAPAGIDLGPIKIGPIEAGFLDDELLSLNIGGPTYPPAVTVDAKGDLGPITISLANEVIEEFPYTYDIHAGIDIPIEGTTGQLDLQQIDLSLALKAFLSTRVGVCTLLVVCPGPMTLDQFITYVNGGTPAGSALGPFPPDIPEEIAQLADINLDQSIGPFTIPEIPISTEIVEDIPVSGSGTLGPFKLPF